MESTDINTDMGMTDMGKWVDIMEDTTVTEVIMGITEADITVVVVAEGDIMDGVGQRKSTTAGAGLQKDGGGKKLMMQFKLRRH